MAGTFRIGQHEIGDHTRCYVIAEIGHNHQGSLQKARELFREAKLAGAQAELEKLAAGSESWQVAAPGGATAGSDTGPLSFSLRQEIRRSREELDQKQQVLSELRIEANLAGVSPEWIGEGEAPAAP